MKFRPTILLLPLLLALAAPLRAAGPYLRGFDPMPVLPPPPAPHDAEDVADRDSAFQVYSARTPAEVAEAKREHKVTIGLFAAAIGPDFQPGRWPLLEALFKDVEAESKKMADSDKNVWRRLRPNVAEPARFVHPSDPETSFSYPSAHATRATALALVLAELFPARRAQILQEGRDIGWIRVKAGGHTPLDIYAGRTLGLAIARSLLANPAFQSDLAAVKAEVSAQKTALPTGS